MVKNYLMDGQKAVNKTPAFFCWILAFVFLSVGCKTKIEQSTEPVVYHYQHEIRLPTKGEINSSTPTLLLLHGHGSNEKDLFSYAKHFDPAMLVVSPRAPITLQPNKYSWYPLNRSQTGWNYDAEAMLASSDKLLDYISQLINDKGVNPDKIYLGGFSQGAIMSLTTGLRYPDKIAGIISLSGEVYPEVMLMAAEPYKLKQTKLFVSHGTQDMVIPVQPIQATTKALKAAGVEISEHYFDIGHSINSVGFNELLKWLKIQINN